LERVSPLLLGDFLGNTKALAIINFGQSRRKKAITESSPYNVGLCSYA